MKSSRRVLELVCVIIGTFIGAGFASGKEVAVYFSKYGFVAVIMCFLVLFLFYFFITKCLYIGKKYCVSDNNIGAIFKKRNKAVRLIVLISSLISVGAMIAGVYSLGIIVGNEISAIILPMICMAIVFGVLIRDYRGLCAVNVIVVPVIVILIIIITATTCCRSIAVTIPLDNVLMSAVGGGVSSIIYVFFNMLSLGILMLQVGYKYSDKEIKVASKIASCIICLLILLITLSITLSTPDVFASDMPLLQESVHIGKFFSIIFAIAQVCGIVTTLLSSTYISSNIVASVTNNKKSAIIIVLLVGVVVSFFGFYNIVNYLYKLTGVLSCIFFVMLYISLREATADLSHMKLCCNTTKN